MFILTSIVHFLVLYITIENYCIHMMLYKSIYIRCQEDTLIYCGIPQDGYNCHSDFSHWCQHWWSNLFARYRELCLAESDTTFDVDVEEMDLAVAALDVAGVVYDEVRVMDLGGALLWLKATNYVSKMFT